MLLYAFLVQRSRRRNRSLCEKPVDPATCTRDVAKRPMPNVMSSMTPKIPYTCDMSSLGGGIMWPKETVVV